MEFKKVFSNGQKRGGYLSGTMFIEKIGIQLTTISYNTNHDDILYKYLQDNFTKSKEDFLKKGIVEISNTLKKVEDYEVGNIAKYREDLFQTYDGETEKIQGRKGVPMNNEDFSNWLNHYAEFYYNRDVRGKEMAVILLNYELLKFKTELSTLGIQTHFNNGKATFESRKESGKGFWYYISNNPLVSTVIGGLIIAFILATLAFWKSLIYTGLSFIHSVINIIFNILK